MTPRIAAIISTLFIGLAILSASIAQLFDEPAWGWLTFGLGMLCGGLTAFMIESDRRDP